jgi:hypothetical protein
MPQEPQPAATILNYRNPSVVQRHRASVAIAFSLPGFLFWTFLLLALLPYRFDTIHNLFRDYWAITAALWLAATACAVASFVYYDGLTWNQRKPWFVEICLAINLVTMLLDFLIGGCVIFPLLLAWTIHLAM